MHRFTHWRIFNFSATSLPAEKVRCPSYTTELDLRDSDTSKLNVSIYVVPGSENAFKNPPVAPHHKNECKQTRRLTLRGLWKLAYTKVGGRVNIPNVFYNRYTYYY